MIGEAQAQISKLSGVSSGVSKVVKAVSVTLKATFDFEIDEMKLEIFPPGQAATKIDRQTICIETGIQNSGLGLIVIFTFFDGNGGMAIIAAWWGIWHIISGLSIAYFFAKRTSNLPAT